MDIEEALGLLEHDVEKADLEGSYWQDEHGGEKVTSRQAFEFVKAQLADAQRDTERLDFLQRKGASVAFSGVEAERQEGGSVAVDYWTVDLGVLFEAGVFVGELTWERNTIRAAIDAARDGEPAD